MAMRFPLLLALLSIAFTLIACGSDSDEERSTTPTYDNGELSFTYPRRWVVDDTDGQIAGANSRAALQAQDEMTDEMVNFILFEANAVLDFELEAGVETTEFLDVLLTDTDASIFGEPIETTLGDHAAAYVVGNDGVVDVLLLTLQFENDNYIIMTGITGEGALTTYQDDLLNIAASMTFSPEPTRVTATDLMWERIIPIEQFQTAQEGDWCDSIPGEAYNVTRNQQQRTTRQVPDGEECREVQVDNGDGTFTQRTECTTTYREEPVFDEYCDYTIDKWVQAGEVTTSGGANDEPTWGEPELQTGDGLGAEREGQRQALYRVELVGVDSGGVYGCDVPAELWQNIQLDSEWTLMVGFLSDMPDCLSLQSASD